MNPFVQWLVAIAAGLFILDWVCKLLETGLREHREMQYRWPTLDITDEEIEQARAGRVRQS
jgi:hypothetical protein